MKNRVNRLILVLFLSIISAGLAAQHPSPDKPRLLISTDIGGTDPDDNQSLIHLLMYSDMFDIEGIVSSPSYGKGYKGQILHAIGLYEKDLPRLEKRRRSFPSPDYLRLVTRQGRRGGAPYRGYLQATEGSDWIIKCANKESDRPLWVLVWGGLDDVVQALHDDPGIRDKIRIYWIGGPNKKWSTNSYAYIAENFPDLWIIEANASYRGFFSNTGVPDSLNTDNYYARYIHGAGYLGKDFKNYYDGRIKMGDTPSLLYMMDGDPGDPLKESWGGSFEKIDHSSRIIFNRETTIADTIPVYSILEFHIKGPKVNIPPDTACITLAVAGQEWDGFYLGEGLYAVRYAPKNAETLKYTITSDIPGFPEQSGVFVVDNTWPGKPGSDDFILGSNWYTDRSDPDLYDGKWQGARTVLKWRNDALYDWAKRWEWLDIDLAPEDVSERYPVYPVPYEYPSVNGIEGILNRVRLYYESTCSLKIIDSETGKEITDFSIPNRNARVSEGFAGEWSYTNGVVLSAFEYIDDVTGDPAFFANNERFFDLVVNTLPYFFKNKEVYGREARGGWGRTPDFHALDDCGSIGAAMIKTYLKNRNEDYLELINTIADYISGKQFRLDDGTLARHRPQYQSVWADDLYMSVPFLANMGVLAGDDKYFDDAVRQILQMASRLYIPEKELFDHGWSVTSADYDPRFYWGRANGWTLMAMAELLDVLPEDYTGRDEVLHLYRSMIRSLAGLQDGTGFWHNMLDKTDTYLETSCTAMFTFAIAKGINEGWINHVYGPVALTGWNAITTRVLENGAVDGTCEGTTFAHDNTYYYHRGKSIYATHGYGPVLYAGAEMIRLLQNNKIEVIKARPNSINSTYHFLLKSEWPEK